MRDPNALVQTNVVTSPFGKEGERPSFTIKRAGNREDIARSNMFAEIKYFEEDGEGGRFYQQKEYPVGDMQLATIELCLVAWDIEDKKGRSVPISRQTIIDYILPEERVWLFNEILAFNPLWQGRREEVKND